MRPIVYILLSIFIMSACGKYDEGPDFSLKTKKSRLHGDWELKAAFINGSLQTSTNYIKYNFSKDGYFGLTVMDNSSGQYLNIQDGTWEFIDKKEFLRLKYLSNGQVVQLVEWKLLRLTNKDFFVEYEDNADKIRMEFKKQ